MIQQNAPTKCPRCGSPKPNLHPAMQFEGEVELCTHPWHREPAAPPDPFSKGYKHHHGEPVSDACGAGRHTECTQDFTKCHCTVRFGHTTPHAYANFLAPPEGETMAKATDHCEHGIIEGACGECRAVASPAPPAELTAAEFFHKHYDKFFLPLFPNGVFRFAEAYAAHLREEIARLMREQRRNDAK